MRHKPDLADADERAEWEALNPEPWMLDLFTVNPGYVSWGPHEDYMWKETKGWDARVLLDSWADFKWQLDAMNECVNFYFEVARASCECQTCGGSGTHVDAQWIAESFYSHSSPFTIQTAHQVQVKALLSSFGGTSYESPHGRNTYPSEAILSKYGPEFRAFCDEMREHGCWNDRITTDEFEALKAADRHNGHKSAREVNDAQHVRGLGSHDAINRWILIEARCKRLGVPQACPACEGRGSLWTAPKAHVRLILWMLHPRKGCSRGVQIGRVEREDLPAVYAWLREAANRNAERFSRIPV